MKKITFILLLSLFFSVNYSFAQVNNSTEVVLFGKKKIIKEHVLFFNRLLDPDDLGWAVTEEVRNEARLFLGIPVVIIKKK